MGVEWAGLTELPSLEEGEGRQVYIDGRRRPERALAVGETAAVARSTVTSWLCGPKGGEGEFGRCWMEHR